MIFFHLIQELLSFKCLTKAPIRGSNVIWCYRSPAAASHFEGQRLASQVSIALPILAPVSGHRHPSCSWPFHFKRYDLTIGTHIGDQDLIEVGAPSNREPHPSVSVAVHPAPSIHCPQKNSLLMLEKSWTDTKTFKRRTTKFAVIGNFLPKRPFIY